MTTTEPSARVGPQSGTATGAVARLERALLRPVDGAWLAAFRVLFGGALAVSMLRFLAYGWVETQFSRPEFRFKYWGAGWVEALPPEAFASLFGVLAALAAAFAAGVAFRLTAGCFWVGFVYLQLVDASNYLNHYYLAALLVGLLCLSPAGRFASVDAWLARRRRQGNGRPAHEGHAAVWLYVFRLQVGVVYFFAGLAKLQSDWLLSGQPLGIWLGSQRDLPLLGPMFELPGAPLAMSWAGFIFDTTIPFWLSWRRTRLPAYAAVIVFHAVTGVLFPIGMFPVIMVLGALVFFPPDWPRRLLGRLPGKSAEQRPPAFQPGQPLPARPRLRRLGLVLAGVYSGVQVLLPLRSWAYGGDVLWHEQGMRWSWRVMVREKNGSVTFRVRQSRTGRVWQISPSRYLTRLQEREMSGQPELIAQLARHVRREFDRRGLGPVEVYVDAWVSLNGRRARRLVDPEVDLGRLEPGLERADWILPAPPEPPPRLGVAAAALRTPP